MYVDRIKLKNVRGFGELEFDLARAGHTHAGWTVFTGDNGAGKSALLKSIAVGLVGRDTARLLQPNFHRWIRHGTGSAEASIEVHVLKCDDDGLVGTGRAPKAAFPAKLFLTNGGKETHLKEAEETGGSITPQRTIWAPEASGWFSCGYGPFRRVFGDSSEAARLMVAPSTERYVTMFQEAASLAEVDRWMRSMKHRVLEGRAADREQLDLLLGLLNDDLMPNQFRIAEVDADGLWLEDRNGVRLSWSEMSDGYRSCLALLADIVRHLVKAFGSQNLVTRSGEGRLEVCHSGVVLIDEIDAHLHPEWQREIGFWLKRHFPKIQFLVTTHSPLVVQAADLIFHLPEPGSDDRPRRLDDQEFLEVIASRPNRILTGPAFGLPTTRSELAVAKRTEHSRLSARRRAGDTLSPADEARLRQLTLFAEFDADE
ncbi:MAG: AAA family ATPase [Planctomycetes bacterium]|nr:AAA family ATPase [Planctomycetota bacterium]